MGERERALSLDVLRSLALWGVMMGNFLHLYSGRMVWPAQDGTLDHVAVHVFAVVVEQKAMIDASRCASKRCPVNTAIKDRTYRTCGSRTCPF